MDDWLSKIETEGWQQGSLIAAADVLAAEGLVTVSDLSSATSFESLFMVVTQSPSPI
jgi:hypothetical protein